MVWCGPARRRLGASVSPRPGLLASRLWPALAPSPGPRRLELETTLPNAKSEAEHDRSDNRHRPIVGPVDRTSNPRMTGNGGGKRLKTADEGDDVPEIVQLRRRARLPGGKTRGTRSSSPPRSIYPASTRASLTKSFHSSANRASCSSWQ